LYKRVIKKAHISLEAFDIERSSHLSGQDFQDLERFYWEREPLFQQPRSQEDKRSSKRNLQSEGEAAYQRGFQAGREIGIKIGRSEIAPQVEFIQKLAQELKDKRDKIIKEAELTVIRLALQIARKVIHQEVSTNPDLILYVVRESLKKVADESKVKVRVNPADLRILEQNKDAIFPNIEPLAFIADDEISCGGCVVETDSGIIDARLEAQLAEIEEALLEEEDVQQI